MKKELIDIRAAITTVSLDHTITRLRRLAMDNHRSDRVQALDEIQSHYRYIKQYLLTGYNDSRREELYRNLQAEVYEESTFMLEAEIRLSNRSFAQAKDEAEKSARERDIDSGILNLRQRDAADGSHDKLFVYYKDLFSTIYSTLVLGAADEEDLTTAVVSQQFDITDCRVLITALMLSQQLAFDIRKLRVLVNIFHDASDDDVKQYALLAIVFAQPTATEMVLYSDELHKAFTLLADSNNFLHDLLGTQLQVLLATDTQQTQKTINEEIVPLFRNNAKQLNPDDDDKSEEQLLDDILHPNKEEEAMEQIEEGMNRIREMRNAGADIFFAGFSQTKRFPFFYTLVNWFLPFTPKHPQIATLDTGEVPAEMIARLMDMQTFCDSDKYSFYLTFTKVVQQLPKGVLDMLKRGEGGDELAMDADHTTAFHRRLYLQDLYRFYTLYSSKGDFFNPFTCDNTVAFITWEPLRQCINDDESLLYLARQMLMRNMFAPLNQLLDSSFDELNLSYLKLKALSAERQGDYAAAMDWFRRALAFEPENPTLLCKMAETAARVPDYATARQLYSTYLSLAPAADTTDEEYKYALCCLQTGDIDAAIKVLYKLYFLHEKNIAYQEALAWGLLLQKKYPEANAQYDLLDTTARTSTSYVRQALLHWLTHDKNGAINTLRGVVRRQMLAQQELTTLLVNENAACAMAISDVDLYVISDIVFDDSL